MPFSSKFLRRFNHGENSLTINGTYFITWTLYISKIKYKYIFKRCALRHHTYTRLWVRERGKWREGKEKSKIIYCLFILLTIYDKDDIVSETYLDDLHICLGLRKMFPSDELTLLHFVSNREEIFFSMCPSIKDYKQLGWTIRTYNLFTLRIAPLVDMCGRT